MAFHYGEVLTRVFAALPAEAPAVVEVGAGRDRSLSWGELDRFSNRLARALLARGLAPGDTLALCMANRLEYVIALVALLKARLVHVNVNFRYRSAELHHVLDHSDAAGVIYDSPRGGEMAAIAGALTKVRLFLEVGEGAQPQVPGALAFARLLAEGDTAPLNPGWDGDDLWFIYTGGTTGYPKAVMIRQDVLFRSQGQNSIFTTYGAPPASLEEHLARVAEHQQPPRRILVCAPLMHAVGLYSTLFPLSYGVGVVLMAGAHFDPLAVLDAVARYAITRFAIVGDAMGVPLVEALRAHPGRWHLEGLEGISSAGMALSRDTKRGLLEALPSLSISDGLGASESPGMAFQVVTRENLDAAADATLALPPTCKVLRGDLSGEVTPGSGEVGLFAKCGLLAEGYYKDPEATAKTFPVIAGTRYVVPGDWAEVLADGRVRFLGRGALCLNSGGEKVYVEEVEAAVRTHRDVADVAVVGVPDPRLGQAVTAVVALHGGAPLDAEGIRARVREQLAGYKVPRHVVAVTAVARLATGKTDYRANREAALAALGLD